MFEGKLATLGGLMAAAVLGVSLPACAQPLLRNLQPFGESRGAANPPVARYVASGKRSFILDREAIAPEALMRFDGSFEVWVLEPATAPRGDTLYRNDAGEPVVKVTRLGGVTLYTQREPDGVPVSIQGDAEELALPPITPADAMLLHLVQAAARAGRASQRQITFTTSPMPPQWTPIFLESFNIVADAIVKLSRDKKAKALLAKLDTVQFQAGPRPDVSLNGSVMVITLQPSKGFAGRPSSNRIMKTCLKR